MSSTVSRPLAAAWLEENGPRELEQLFKAIIYHPSAPILITDNDRHYRDASFGAAKLLGLPREKVIGRSLDDPVDPSFKPKIPQLWQAFLQEGSRREPSRWWVPMAARGSSSMSPSETCCQCATCWSCATSPRNRASRGGRQQRVPSLCHRSKMGTGLRPLCAGHRRQGGGMVFRSGAHFRLLRR